MPMTLIKNNLKIMLRSKGILIMMILMPIVTIALLSNAFHDLLDVNYEIDSFHVGYFAEGDEKEAYILEGLNKIFAKNEISFTPYDSQEETVESLLQQKTVDIMVEFSKDGYTIYKTPESEMQASIVESIFSGFFLEVQRAKMGNADTTTYVNRETLAIDPVPSSVDYYGIIEVIYFTWCGIVSLAAVISSERKNRIEKRLRMSQASKISLFFGKLLPCVLATMIQMGIVMIVSIFCMDIHWGNWPGTIGILILLTLTASSLGIVLFYMFNSIAMSIVAAWIFIFNAGFLGGTFQTYMYSTIPDRFAKLSPIYYVNRTLVEYSTMGKSETTIPCVVILLGMFVVCSIVGILLMSRRMEDK